METSSEYSYLAKYLRYVRGLDCNLKKWENLKLYVNEPPYCTVSSVKKQHDDKSS